MNESESRPTGPIEKEVSIHYGLTGVAYMGLPRVMLSRFKISVI